jgi:hypothetical protein
MEPHKIINLDTFKVKEVYEKIAENFNDKRFSKWDWVEEFLDQFIKC